MLILKRLSSVISVIAIVVLSLFLFTSCTPETPEPPYGVWMSYEPRIVLYFKSEYRVPDRLIYVGFYTIDEVETKVFAHFGRGQRFTVNDSAGMTEGGGILGSGRLLSGSYRVVRNEIHYTLTPHYQEQLGIETIIFQRLETYNPIDPYYWFPQFFPRSD